ncbi:MAG TPA: hypothetical protein VFI90_08815 [Rubrobacter sp.]|nr:hypothetical protein [Rubrobacter sp.]
MKPMRAKLRSRREGSTNSGSSTGATLWLWLTVPVAILTAVAAGSELLVDGIFRGDAQYFVAQAIGQDVITLGVALPALIGGAIFADHGSGRARLVWLGTLTYLVYTYVIYAFQVQFNSLFLVYVALLGCSLYALIGGLATTDSARIKAGFTRKTPVRTVSIFLAIVAVCFYVSWLGEVVPALLGGGVPQSVTVNGTPTNGVHVLDMAWMLPAMGLTAIWLWRKLALGYALAGALLTFMSLLLLAIIGMVVSMSLHGQPVAPEMAVVFAAVAATSLVLTVWYLKKLSGDHPAATDDSIGQL